MDAYAGCMYYYTNEFDLCRKEQKEFETAFPVSEQSHHTGSDKSVRNKLEEPSS